MYNMNVCLFVVGDFCSFHVSTFISKNRNANEVLTFELNVIVNIVFGGNPFSVL